MEPPSTASAAPVMKARHGRGEISRNRCTPAAVLTGVRDTRVPAGPAAALLCVLLAGCGSASLGQVRSAGRASGPASRASGPASRATSAGPGRLSPAAAPGCPAVARLRPGEPVAGWRLGAVDFLSGRLGVALTAPQVPCLVRPGPGRGRQVQVQPQPVLLAVTSDGGRHWTTQGESLTSSPQSEVAEQVVATSAQDAWALSDTGTLRSTGDRGVTWALPPLPRPVVALASGPGPTAAAPLWALSCPPSGQGSCTPVLDRKLTPAGRWQRLPVPALAAQPPPHLAVLSAGTVVLLLTQASDGRPLLVSSTDSGQHWTTRPAPAGPGHLCASDTSISAAGPDDWLLLCAGGFAAGSSTKALLRSTDAGRSWVTLSAVRSLTVPPRPGSLPVSDALVLTAGSATRLWLALPNGAATSTDGGRTWSGVAGVRPQGWVAALDVRSATMAWLLAPGAGLWQTTDGDTWRLLGAAFRYR